MLIFKTSFFIILVTITVMGSFNVV